MSLGELQREQMTDEDREIALWVSDKMPQLVKDLTRICRIPSVAVVPEDKKPPYGPECVRVLDEMLQIGSEYGLDTKILTLVSAESDMEMEKSLLESGAILMLFQ
jgi:hypothetical protein